MCYTFRLQKYFQSFGHHIEQFSVFYLIYPKFLKRHGKNSIRLGFLIFRFPMYLEFLIKFIDNIVSNSMEFSFN